MYGIDGVECCFRKIFRYRHLMLNMVSLLPHCKKDNKVESKETKGATLNELVELKNCSSCLFFEVFFFIFHKNFQYQSLVKLGSICYAAIC